MRSTICIALVCAFVAMVAAEECRDVNDCGHVTCPENDYTLECHNRQCTCTQSRSTCASAGDCKSAGDNCRFGWHCIDQACRCGFGFGGGK